MSGAPGRGALKDVNSGLESLGQRTKGSPTERENSRSKCKHSLKQLTSASALSPALLL